MSDMSETESPSELLIGGHRCFVDPSDGRGAALVAAAGPLHPTSVELWRSMVNLEPWDWILDLGANYGELLLSVELPPSAEIRAYEPNRRVVPYLRRSLATAVPRAEVVPVAVGDFDGTFAMHEDLSWSGNSTLAGEWTSDRDHEWAIQSVPVRSLTSILDDLPVAASDTVLLKVDIEGLEARVLRAAHERLRSLRRCALMLEIVRFADEDLEWLQATHLLHAFDVERGAFVPCLATDPREIRALLGKPSIYRRDLMAEPRR